MKPPLELMAEALMQRDALKLRMLALEWMREKDATGAWDKPVSCDETIFIAGAALAELFADRLKRPAPAWTAQAGVLPEPFFALAAANRFRSVRECCEKEAPASLRRHGIYAPSNFLAMV